jgi:hypothetical protein
VVVVMMSINDDEWATRAESAVSLVAAPKHNTHTVGFKLHSSVFGPHYLLWNFDAWHAAAHHHTHMLLQPHFHSCAGARSLAVLCFAPLFQNASIHGTALQRDCNIRFSVAPFSFFLPFLVFLNHQLEQ